MALRGDDFPAPEICISRCVPRREIHFDKLSKAVGSGSRVSTDATGSCVVISTFVLGFRCIAVFSRLASSSTIVKLVWVEV